MARPPLPTAGPGVRLPAPMCGSQDGSGGRGRAVGEQAPCVGLWPLWSGPGQGPGGAPPLSAPDSGGQRVPGLARSRVSLRGAWHGRGQPARAARRGRRRRGASGRCGRTVTSKTQPSSPAPPPRPAVQPILLLPLWLDFKPGGGLEGLSPVPQVPPASQLGLAAGPIFCPSPSGALPVPCPAPTATPPPRTRCQGPSATQPCPPPHFPPSSATDVWVWEGGQMPARTLQQ